MGDEKAEKVAGATNYAEYTYSCCRRRTSRCFLEKDHPILTKGWFENAH